MLRRSKENVIFPGCRTAGPRALRFCSASLASVAGVAVNSAAPYACLRESVATAMRQCSCPANPTALQRWQNQVPGAGCSVLASSVPTSIANSMLDMQWRTANALPLHGPRAPAASRTTVSTGCAVPTTRFKYCGEPRPTASVDCPSRRRQQQRSARDGLHPGRPLGGAAVPATPVVDQRAGPRRGLAAVDGQYRCLSITHRVVDSCRRMAAIRAYGHTGIRAYGKRCNAVPPIYAGGLFQPIGVSTFFTIWPTSGPYRGLFEP